MLYGLWTRDRQLWRHLYIGAGTAVTAAITIPWFVLIGMRVPGFAHFFFLQEHFARYLTNEADRWQPASYCALCNPLHKNPSFWERKV